MPKMNRKFASLTQKGVVGLTRAPVSFAFEIPDGEEKSVATRRTHFLLDNRTSCDFLSGEPRSFLPFSLLSILPSRSTAAVPFLVPLRHTFLFVSVCSLLGPM